MIATQYDEKIDVTRNTETQDANGIPSTSWAAHLTALPAKIQWKKGVDIQVRDRITSRRFAVVYCAILDIQVTDRITYDSELYNIVSVIKPANRFMMIEIERNTEEAA